MKFPLRRREQPGFVLAMVVVMVALLAIMAVAYLSSSSLERATARASVNKTKADLAARAAADIAIARLRDNISQFPDSAVSWETINNAWTGTVLYFREQPPEATATATPAPLKILPLISGATAEVLADKNNTLPATADETNSFNLNHARFSGDAYGWVGAPPGTSTPPEFRAQWINQTNSDNQITSRYAYWIEDQSFKVNANLMGRTPRGSDTLGDSPTQIPLQGLIKNLLPGADTNGLADAIFDLRGAFPNQRFFEFRALGHIPNQGTLPDVAKFESTIYSGALNLSRSGSKRANLNKIIRTSTDPTEIREQLRQVMKAITYHLPNFGQRFYRTGTDLNSLDVTESGTPGHRTIYLNKIAANIRDYIDTDSQPTIVNNNANCDVRMPMRPAFALGAIGMGTTGSNEVVAIGKERVPFFSEYMLRVKQLIFDRRGPYPPDPPANYRVEIDHYVEFWNMSNRDITVADLGPNPFFRVANQFGWNATGTTGVGGTNIPEGAPRDFSIPLGDFRNAAGAPLIFAAGTATVLTTDASTLPVEFTNVDATRVFRATPQLANEFRVYSGTTTLTTASNRWLRLKSDIRSTSGDYETEILLGNDLGILDSSSQGAFITDISVDVDTPSEDKLNPAKWHFRGSRPNGNIFAATPSTTGDPRTNNEQLELRTTTDSDRTRYKAGTVDSTNRPGESTLTQLNANFVDTTKWTDPSSSSVPDAAHAPSVVANAELKSIGQLGSIFDPARRIGVSNDIKYSRGGGRSLRIGQPERYASGNLDGLWDGNTQSKSREWTAWRLVDIFAVNDLVQLDGRINVNGVARDDGAALKAALFGYNFQTVPESDPQFTGSLQGAVVDELVNQLKARLSNSETAYSQQFAGTSGPLFERGEFSEMPIFNPGTGLSASASTPVVDRGREELFRRLAELITTRGNVFTVYAVGQALTPQPSTVTAPPRVLSTTRFKMTFRLDPVWTTSPPADPFNPNDTASVAARFKKPDRYAIKILYAGE